MNKLKRLLSPVGVFLFYKYHIPIDNNKKGCIISIMNSLLEQYIELFDNLDTGEVYDTMLEVGSQVNVAVQQTPQNTVHGCQSQVWIQGVEEPTGWEFFLDSDSFMVKGVGSIVCKCMSGMTTDELAQVTFYDFKDIAKHFSQQRKQGIQAIINKCKAISRG